MTSHKKSPATISCHKTSRRDFLAGALATTAMCLFPYKAVAAVSKVFITEKSLSFYNTHTGENLTAIYWSEGTYLPQALADINYILRDYRTGDVKAIDTDLLDLLFVLHQKLESKRPFNIISGYRSQETNFLLNSASRGVAKNSLHIDGKAIDIRIPGYELKTLKRAAVDLRRGGVGYYPVSDFVHVDVGRIRYW
jgi:uncharacterized protein YcbK (DUF882 family)